MKIRCEQLNALGTTCRSTFQLDALVILGAKVDDYIIEHLVEISANYIYTEHQVNHNCLRIICIYVKLWLKVYVGYLSTLGACPDTITVASLFTHFSIYYIYADGSLHSLHYAKYQKEP